MNRTWDARIAQKFARRLRFARDKAQYLRIQASYLTKTHPNVALDLLDQFFALNESYDRSQAYLDRGLAFETLGENDKAVTAMNAALTHEATDPRVLTDAYIELPRLIVEHGLVAHFDHALSILDGHADRLLFKRDRYLWYGARAVILASQTQPEAAKVAAKKALSFIDETHSGYDRYPDLGLVNGEDLGADLYQKLLAIQA